MEKRISLLLFSLLFSLWGLAQSKTYKEVKTLNKEIPFKAGERILLQGERTFMTIKSWDKDFIQASVAVVSRHTVQEQAKADLEKIVVLFDKKGKTHTYSNAIQLGKTAEKPKSNLKVELQLLVPFSAALEIVNHFGKIDIEGGFQSVKTISEFSDIQILDFEGDASIQTKYGDTNIQQSQGNFEVNADRSNLTLQEVYGQLQVDIKYGELEVHHSAQASTYNIDAKYSPVKLHIPLGTRQDLRLECVQCDIVSNDEGKVSEKTEQENGVQARVKSKVGSPSGTVRSEVENITLVFENN